MKQKLHLTHDYDDALEVRHGDTTLFRYVYQPRMAEDESPKPYFHPVQDLAGNLVTIFRPYDHVWHKGIAMTIAHMEDQNFWGGASYRHGRGYVPLPNNGTQRHDAWDAIDFDGESFHANERLSWITQSGEHWLAEERQIGLPAIDADAGTITVDHGAVPAIEWPAMTMGFQADEQLRQDVAVGDTISFDFTTGEGGNTITSITKK